MKRWLKRLLKSARAAPKVIDPGPDHRALGDAARGRRDWPTAAFQYRSHLDQDPGDFGIWVQLGHVYKEQGQLAQAEEAYAEAGALNEGDADLWLNRGHLAKLRSENLAAREFYLRSYAIDANDRAVTELDALGVATAELRPEPVDGVEARAIPMREVGGVEAFDGRVLTGWAFDPDHPDVSAEVEVLKNGKVIRRGITKFVRDEPQPSGPGAGVTGFSIDIGEKVVMGDIVVVRLRRTREPLVNSPFTLELGLAAKTWLMRHQVLTGEEIAATRAHFARETAGLKLSVVLPMSDGPLEWLSEAIDSVLGQWCPHWELMCINDGSDVPLGKALAAYASADARIRIIQTESGSRGAEAAIAACVGDYVAVMHPRTVLEPEAVFRFLDAGLSGAGILYSDEAQTTRDLEDVREFILRPAFSYDHFLSRPDLGQVVCFRIDVARASIGMNKATTASVPADLMFRVLEETEEVAHVPAILHRTRRSLQDDLGRTEAQRSKTRLSALNRHLKRSGHGAVATPGFRPGVYRVDYPDDLGRTLIVIPTRDRVDLLEPCLEAIWRTTDDKSVEIVVIDHESREAESKRYLRKVRKRVKVVPFSGKFNYARMHNEVVAKVGEGFRYLVFMNNDIEAIEAGWLERMRSLAARPDVGVVGSTLLYDDGRIQHAGVVLGAGGPVNHAHKFTPLKIDGRRTSGPNASLISTRDYSAVTGACVAMRSEVFLGVGGFDEDLPVDYNDIDLCLRIGGLGYRILNDAYSVLYHHESATRTKKGRVGRSVETAVFVRRWRTLLSQGDPFYNPLLSMVTEHALGHVADAYHPIRVRPVNPKLRPLFQGRARRVARPQYSLEEASPADA